MTMFYEQLKYFFSFSDPSVRYVTLGCITASAGVALTGCFSFLRKRTLSGDTASHAVLPGICLAFMFSHEKNLLILLGGAFVTAWLSLACIDVLTRRTKIKEDTAIAAVLSVFFGVGVFLLAVIQKSGEAAQTGLDKFLLGKAAAITGEDLPLLTMASLIILVVIRLFMKEFTLVAFDKNFATTIGLPVRRLETLLTGITVFSIVIAIQAVGVVLTVAMLIAPASAARYWTNRLPLMLILATLFGMFSGMSGAFISFTASNMPTGPWIVVSACTIAFFSFLFGSKKGIFRSNSIKKIRH